jgi:hypothetical protein
VFFFFFFYMKKIYSDKVFKLKTLRVDRKNKLGFLNIRTLLHISD